MNSSAEIYKQKYLKYKMKYLSLQKGGLKLGISFAQALKGAIQESIDPTKITKPQRDEICETKDFTIVGCNELLKDYSFPINTKLSTDDQLKDKEKQLKIAKENMLNRYQIIEYKDGSTFEGKFASGKRYQGILKDKSGQLVYQGTFNQDGTKKGTVKLSPYSNSNKWRTFIEYEGEVNCDPKKANVDKIYKGTQVGDNNICYPDGYGIMKFKDGEYKGYFKDGSRIGYGEMTYTNGSSEKGMWEKNNFVKKPK